MDNSQVKRFLEGQFLGPNLGYILEMYETYQTDPDLVSNDLKDYFQNLEARSKSFNSETIPSNQHLQSTEKILAAVKLAEQIRVFGHLSAKVSPITKQNYAEQEIDPASFGLLKEDLEKLPAELLCDFAPKEISTGWDAYQFLIRVYTNSIAYEFGHIHDAEEKKWLQEKVETGSVLASLSKQKRIGLFKRLAQVELFEKFLHRTFVGQKRFSIEGLDSMIPLIDEIVTEAVQDGAKTINIGMAHRGRLNVLAHVLCKPYEKIFSEFQHAPNKELVPSEGSIGINYGWTGDVKYHLGLDRQIKEENTVRARLTLANNPSHLEYVGAVVEGFTRAAQDERSRPGYPHEEPQSALAILVHGDAAFPGEGIVAETLNLSRLKGYRTGGSIHIIANNTIGFTTEAMDSRSTRYASDLAKGYEIPIVHVNADDPEACLAVAKLAAEYRSLFNKDFLIDLIGYRRFGHNEMDEPMTTNPRMYNLIHKHPTVKEIYGKSLKVDGVLNDSQVKDIEEEITGVFQKAFDNVSASVKEPEVHVPQLPVTIEKGFPDLDTTVPTEVLKRINEELLFRPEKFQVYTKLERILGRRKEMFEQGKIDWGHAESLAFATILSEGIPIRLTGQDSERGTFAQRNLVLHDSVTGEKYSPLHQLSTAKASFAIHNSPLSEGSVLGFEYGYNIYSPESLVIWEAQYGDFANAAQVIFDQFIAAGRAKWGQKSGLVMLLPHGYEGQGPEHSSGRLERFLQSAAENNWTVVNLTTSAQYFHLLRRQALMLKREEIRPLVVMSPKSLLRNPLVSSSGVELSTGKFKAIIAQPDSGTNSEIVERVVLCSGKIAIDLAEKMKEYSDLNWLRVLRIEEIYPFPAKILENEFNKYPNLHEICWIQEEPKNMGAWSFVEPRIQEMAPNGIKVEYIGRRRRSSPAEGDPNVHKLEQAQMILKALSKQSQGGE
ncbi:MULTISPECIES: 2-oxoglutarate dehydrogenase E1 component [unclassified Bacillus (in: firmicutes)]|uniref:2-oxoglutarate dehydrogenase E1 component n=1 Tax=unclassified Bacillus (in: firmicutes) TaxID=185979 RepID=UPI0008E3BCE6|nr:MULTISPECIES: 2-oxoglutarate dehydrogenase E1 component [unclassified Bacillus (in: firmicutes)]SFA91569.1 2-oxoglutarate dehydrogenase E1 component [Bacillus sp. UNCCL13]SFQ85601.1 2-oxoglutarate dehydrogenase E1 component [Bacillus sp. cl95]